MRHNTRIQLIPPLHQTLGLMCTFGHGECQDMCLVLVTAVQREIPRGLETFVDGLPAATPAEVTSNRREDKKKC